MSLNWPLATFFVRTQNSLCALRRRIIADTERYLNARLSVGDTRRAREPWRTAGPSPRRYHGNCARRPWPTPAAAMQDMPASVTVLEVEADRGGRLDDARMRRLLSPLARLAGEVRRGDVVIDLSRVHVLNLESLRRLSSLARRMRRQRRQLVLCGVRDDCGGVGHISGLGIVCYPTQAQAVECLSSRACV